METAVIVIYVRMSVLVLVTIQLFTTSSTFWKETMTNLDKIKAEARKRFDERFVKKVTKRVDTSNSIELPLWKDNYSHLSKEVRDFLLSEIGRAVEEAKLEAAEEIWQAIDAEFESFKIDVAFRPVITKYKDDLLQKLSTLAKDSKENEVEGGDSFNDHMETEDKYWYDLTKKTKVIYFERKMKNSKTKIGGETMTASVSFHDCFDSLHKIWHNQGMDANYSECGLCGRITGFKWKSWINRIIWLFREPWNLPPTLPRGRRN